jgi:DNA-binding NarL/FixJ family response regulator
MSPNRVVIGDFGAVARLGLLDILAEEGLEVVGHARSLSEVRPDVVVLDLDDESAQEVAIQITSEFPAIKVVACSCEEPVMQVFPPFHNGESYLSQLTRAHLAQALHH